MTTSNLKFKTVKKDQLFYDNYHLCIRVQMQYMSTLRTLNHDAIDAAILWRRESRRPYFIKLKNGEVIPNKLTDELAANLHHFADLLMTTEYDHKFVVGYNTAYIYCNDIELIESVNALDYVSEVKCTKVDIDRPKGTFIVNDPKHKFRTFLKSLSLTEKDKKAFVAFLQNQGEEARMSPGLAKWAQGRFTRTMDYQFFDHNDPGILIMLSLIRPGLIRKTCDIIAR